MKVFDIIKCDVNNDVFAWKFPGEDFNTNSQLIVSESQEAVFFKDGRALDLFTAGRYTLHTQNIPLLRRIVNIPFNGVSPFSCQVYFINKVVSMDVTWGTNSPIPIQDEKYKIIIPIRANGQFAVRVRDSKKFLISLVGTVDLFDQSVLKRYFKGILMSNIKDYISKQFVLNKLTFLEITSHIREISDGIGNSLSEEFDKYGIELINFNTNEISPPENDPSYMRLKESLARRAARDVEGYNYQQEQAFKVLGKAAENEGSAGNVMGAGMGLGMGVNLGGIFGSTMANAMNNVQSTASGTATEQSADGESGVCHNCGEKIPANSKFCLSCGAKIEKPAEKENVVCPNCGATVTKGKFCLECGAKLEPVCAKCGAKLVPNAKFCFECGNKID